jgi:Cu/Ag efflux pump CusA
MGTRSIRWPLVSLVVLTLAVFVLVAVGAYLVFQRWGRGSTWNEDDPHSHLVVVAAYPGTSAEEVERQVTIPLEVTFAGSPGLKSVRSKSRSGLAYLRLEFESWTEHEKARHVVINRLAMIDQPLPPGVSPALSPASAGHEILRYALRGPRDARGEDIYSPADLRALQDWVVEREFRRVPRVLDTTSGGGTVTRYEVLVDPERLRRYGLTLREVQTAIAEANGNVGGDVGGRGGVALTVRAVGLFGGGEDPVQGVLGLKDPREAAGRLRAQEQRRLREIRALVIARVNGVPVRLEDVVEGGRLAPGEEVGRTGVVLGRQSGQGRTGLARRGEPDEDDPVLGVVFLRPGEDLQAALDDVKAKVQEINDTPGLLLPGVRLEPLWYRERGAAEDILILQAGFSANVSPQVAAEKMRQARAILLHYPEVRAVLSEVGPDETGSDWTGAEGARILALLDPEKDRPRSRGGLLDEVQTDLSRAVAGIDWDFLPDGVDDFEAAFVATPGAGLLKIYGPDLDELQRLAEKAKTELRKLEGVSDVHFRHLQGQPQLDFSIDPDKCARWGVSVADVKNVTALAVGDQRATRIIQGEKSFDLTLRWPQPLRSNAASILDLPVDATNNRVMPGEGPGVAPAPPLAAPSPRLRLRDLVSPRGADGHPDPQGAFVRPGIAAIWREQGRRLIAVRFRIRNRKEADVVAEAERMLAFLFAAPYRAEWSAGVVKPRHGTRKP